VPHNDPAVRVADEDDILKIFVDHQIGDVGNMCLKVDLTA
jgi:hypothetical protein